MDAQRAAVVTVDDEAARRRHGAHAGTTRGIEELEARLGECKEVRRRVGRKLKLKACLVARCVADGPAFAKAGGDNHQWAHRMSWWRRRRRWRRWRRGR